MNAVRTFLDDVEQHVEGFFEAHKQALTDAAEKLENIEKNPVISAALNYTLGPDDQALVTAFITRLAKDAQNIPAEPAAA
jgi:hypothetical protein